MCEQVTGSARDPSPSFNHPFLTSYHHHLLWCSTQVRRVNKGSTRRPSPPPLLPWEPSPSLPRPAFMHPLSPRLCLGNIDPLVAGFATPPHSTPHPQPPPQGAIPHPTSPAFVHPPSPRLRLGNVDTPLVKHPAPLDASWGPRGSSGLPRPRAIPLPLSTPRVAPRGAPRYLRLSRSLPPPIRSAMVHPTPLLLARLWHPKRAIPSAGPAWWPGASALGFGHLPRCWDLGLGLGLYLPRLGCLGVPWCACGLRPYVLSPPSPFTL